MVRINAIRIKPPMKNSPKKLEYCRPKFIYLHTPPMDKSAVI